MVNHKFGRLLLPAFGIVMLVLSVMAVSPVAAQSSTATPMATSAMQGSPTPAVGAATVAPVTTATPVVPVTGAAPVAQCYTYNDLVNLKLQPGSLYYVANSGDTLKGIANKFGISEAQLIQANTDLTSMAQAGVASATPMAGVATATPLAGAGVPATGAVDLNSCVVSGVSANAQPLDQGQVNGQSYVLMQGELLQIPVNVSSLIPATGSVATATPMAGMATSTPAVPQTGATSTQAVPQTGATSTPNASGTSQAVPATGANFSVSPQDFQNRIFMFQYPQGSQHDGFYIAKNGDYLYALAQRWGVSYQDLINANPEIGNPNMLYRGEAIRIPKGARVQAPPASSIIGTSTSSVSTSTSVPATSTPNTSGG